LEKNKRYSCVCGGKRKLFWAVVWGSKLEIGWKKKECSENGSVFSPQPLSMRYGPIPFSLISNFIK